MSDYNSGRFVGGCGEDKGKRYLPKGLDLKKYSGRMMGWFLVISVRW